MRHGGRKSTSHCWAKFRKKVIDNEFELLRSEIKEGRDWALKARESQTRLLAKYAPKTTVNKEG